MESIYFPVEFTVPQLPFCKHMKELISKLFGRNRPEPPDLESTSLTRSEKMRAALTYSEGMLAKRFSPERAQLVVFETCCGNILDMTEELKKHNAVMASGGGIKASDTIYDFVNTNLDQFFVDPKNNTYINQHAYRLFHTQAELFCKLVHECSLAEFGRLEHNYRCLRPVIASVTEICNGIGKAVS